MKKLLLLTVMLAGIQLSAQNLNYQPGEVLVQLLTDRSPADLSAATPEVQIIKAELLSRPLNMWRLIFDDSQLDTETAVSQLYANTLVIAAQKNHLVVQRAVPDDALFGNQWQYYQDNDRDIDADEAWDVTTGGLTPNGDEIVVAVVDGGSNLSHPDLQSNLWVNTAEIPDNGIDDDANGYIDDIYGWDPSSNSGNIPVDGHGTAVNGIVGADGNNGLGVTGVNWDVKVMTLTYSGGGGGGFESRVITAYSYALEARMLYNDTDGAEGAFVVATNASFGVDFGDPDDFPLWCSMYDTLGENGILSCGATINGNFNVDVIGDVPTACPSGYLIAVTNTNINDVKVTSAGYGLETIDLGAPGSGAYTLSTGGYGGFGGTSGATPHVTGTIALLYSAPCGVLADLALSDPARAARRVRDLILDGVDPNTSLDGITTTGGRLNVNNSVQKLLVDCATLSTSDFDNPSDSIQLYPNPTNDQFTITNKSGLGLSEVGIYTVEGRLVNQEQNPGNNMVSLASLPQGVYIVRFSFDGDPAVYNKIVLKQ